MRFGWVRWLTTLGAGSKTGALVRYVVVLLGMFVSPFPAPIRDP